MPAPHVTVVVPLYNYGRYVRECIDSILVQDGETPLEIVVVDDGSTDDGPQQVAAYNDPRIKLIRHERNLGHAATVETGLRHARGDLIARIDPDDRYRPNFLALTVGRFQEFPEVGLVYGDAAQIDESGRVTAPSSDRLHAGDYRGNELVPLLEENFICSCTVIAKREGWLNALPVPAGLAFHDWYFTLMIARRYDFYYLDEVIADYRVHPQNMHTNIVKDKTEEPSTFWLLDHIFSERESDPDLDRQKQAARRTIYSAHYVTLGMKYFGFGMLRDTRRCLVRAIRYRPRLMFRFDIARWLFGSLIGLRAYESLKGRAKRLRARS